MAKKKQARGSSSNGGSEEADRQPQQEDQQQQQQLEQEASGDVAAAVEQQAVADDDTGMQELSVEQLRAELAAARAEIQQLRAELAVKSEQRDVVKPSSSSSSTHDVAELQEKLARLRKEQQAADAARDKAWQQLKAVVEDISSLANPDYLQSVQIRPHD